MYYEQRYLSVSMYTHTVLPPFNPTTHLNVKPSEGKIQAADFLTTSKRETLSVYVSLTVLPFWFQAHQLLVGFVLQ